MFFLLKTMRKKAIACLPYRGPTPCEIAQTIPPTFNHTPTPTIFAILCSEENRGHDVRIILKKARLSRMGQHD